MDFLKDREADLEGAPVVTEAGDRLDAFSREGRKAILSLLVTLGDNKYKLGRRYSEWATSGPTLEASVAAASMTSDEMGHARSLYPLLRKFPDAPPELKKEEDRTEFHNVSFLDRPFATWAELIAAASLFDKAMTVLVAALSESAYSPLRHRAAKILQEERYHALYADGWLETLAKEEGTRAELRDAMNRIWLETLAWFGPDDDPLFTAGVSEKLVNTTGGELRERFVRGVRRTVEPVAGVGFPQEAAIPWERWDAANRRLRPGAR
jgi:phenylacetate-CoA oxygenase PaaI subunit